jgi:hypothetical protein
VQAAVGLPALVPVAPRLELGLQELLQLILMLVQEQEQKQEQEQEQEQDCLTQVQQLLPSTRCTALDRH